MVGDEASDVPGNSTPRNSTPCESARRRADEVFGDVLPETTADERDPRPPGADSDSWYLENRPPHHDH